jgi:hypothetical protein
MCYKGNKSIDIIKTALCEQNIHCVCWYMKKSMVSQPLSLEMQDFLKLTTLGGGGGGK